MKAWLDDVRKAPPGWLHVKTASEAIGVCMERHPEEISLDYDLDAVTTGYCQPPPGCGGDVSSWLLDRAKIGDWDVVPNVIRIHSSNEDGVKEMAWQVAEIERLRWAAALGLPPDAAWIV